MHNYSCIVINSLFRSRGTYFLDKFDKLRQFVTYHEPDHERLLDLKPSDGEDTLAITRAQHLRHPTRDKFYFEHFPFKPEGGVPYFDKRFSYDNYLGRNPDPDLKWYLTNLMLYSTANGNGSRLFWPIPVFKMCRFTLRTEWLTRNLGTLLHVYLVRNPEDTFRSYWSFQQNKSWFIHALILTIAKNRHDCVFEEIADALGLPNICEKIWQREFDCAQFIVTQELLIQNLRDAFFFLWALSLAHNIQHSAIVIDTDLMVTQPAYKSFVATKFEFALDVDFDFDDIKHEPLPPAPGMVVSQVGLEITRRAIKKLNIKFDKPMHWYLFDTRTSDYLKQVMA